MAKKRPAPVRSTSSVVRPPPADPRPKNQLLANLPAAEFRRLAPHLKTVPVKLKQVLHRQGERLRHVYFPNGGVISITTTLSDGTFVECGTVGDEGLVGIEAYLSEGAVAPGQALMQVPDTNAEMLDVDIFRRELDQRGMLYESIGVYVQIVIAQLMQTTACNVAHQVQQRCARWLLMTHDRMHGHDFTLSHEFLAIMLGVQRPTVSVVAGVLQKAKLINYRHGRVTILDRTGLEAASCDCYPSMRAQYDRL